MASDDNSDGLQRAIVHGQPASRDIEGRRLLAAVRARMFVDAQDSEPVEIGRYRIRQRLGQGGMGVVYSAHDPQLDRQVALKLVRPGPGARRERPARLLREAQALALLSHPNVVPVYDAGRHGDQVFLAMAYIEGKTLDRWQAQLRPWPEVVSNYLQAGRGLAAAHAAGLVHRDFKPANVMLADDRRILVMDFGLVAGQTTTNRASPRDDIESVIARLAERRSMAGEDPVAWEALTRSGQIVGTYSYMSPEQQEGKSADALADQFSFCTAFLEALQGEFPFVGDTPEELYASKRTGRFVEDPPRPGFPRRLRRALMRGLAAEPHERWEDLSALLAEVERAGRRSRWIMVAAGGVALAGVGGLGWSLAVAAECDGAAAVESVYGPERRRAVGQAMRQTGLEYAEHTAAAVADRLDAYTEQWARAYDHACGLQEEGDPVLDRRWSCLEDRRRSLVALVEVLLFADDSLVEGAVEIASGLPPVERCSDSTYLSVEIQWPQEPKLAERVEGLRSRVATARALTNSGRLAEAGAIVDEVTVDPDTLESPALRCEVELTLGELQRSRGDLERAAQTLEQAYFRAMGAGHYEVAARASTRLVALYGAELSQMIDGRAWARHAQGPISELGGDPLDRAELDHARGLVLLQDRQHEEAEAAFERALAAFKARLGGTHPAVARALHSLGLTAQGQGHFAEAVEFHRQALEIVEQLFGNAHPNRARNLTNLAKALQRVGRTKEALIHQREALRIRRALFGDSRVEVAESLASLGVLLREAGKLAEAADIQREALAVFEHSLGLDHASVGVALVDLANTLNRDGKLLAAKEALDRCAAIFDTRLSGGHSYRILLAKERASNQVGSGESDAARETLEAALLLCGQRPVDAGACTETRIELAELLLERDKDRARQLAQEAAASFASLRLHDPTLSRRLAQLELETASASVDP